MIPARTLLATAALATFLNAAHAQSLSLTFHSSITNSLGESVVFDPGTNTAFGNGATGVEYASINSSLQFGTLGSIDFTSYVAAQSLLFNGVSSVAIDPLGRGFGAAAVITGNASTSTNGLVVFFNTANKSIIGHRSVGYHPDMLTFNSSGTRLLVANESDNAITNGDSLTGSISNLDVSSVTGLLDFTGVTTTTTDFSAVSSTMLQGVRDHGAAMNTATSTPNLNRIEPEYISVSGNTAYVALQEANTVGVFDIPTNTWTGMQKLGAKLQVMDPINNSTISVNRTIAALPMPDAISSFTVGNQTYFATANEGDYRDNNADRRNGSAFSIGNATVGFVDPTYSATLNATYGGNWRAGSALGGTRFLANSGDLDGDGDIDQLQIGGSRSMSIYNASTGTLLFDTNDLAGFGGFETWIAANDPTAFNIDQAGNSTDVRSRDKGPEPEALALGVYNDDLYALVGMERTNHLFLFRLIDGVSTATVFDPAGVEFLHALRWGGQHGPETISFMGAGVSPSGEPAFLVGSEISNTWAIYSIPEPSTVGLAVLGAAGLVALRLRRRR